MPQFDFYSFPGQVFWTLIMMFFFYFFIVKYYLVPFSEVFKIRQKLFKRNSETSLDINNSEKKIYSLFI